MNRSTAAILAMLLSSTSAYAVDMTNARVFITPTGNDAQCSPQPVIAGQNPNLINPPTIACRTIQHACDIALGIPMVHVAPAAGTYPENVTCAISGPDAAHPVFFHIAEQVQPLGAVHMTGAPGVVKPILEMTGDFVHFGCAFCHIENGAGDGVYMHGLDARHAQGQHIYYGTDISRNAGNGVRLETSDNAIITSDTIANNVVGGIYVKDSIAPHIYSNAIYRVGAIAGIPPVKGPAAVITNSPGGEFEDNKALYAVSVGLILDHSPGWTVDNNKVTAANWPAFTWSIVPVSDTATDTIFNN